MKTIDQSVVEVIARSLLLDESQISESASLAKDLHADSLDAVEIIMSLEDRFGIEIPDEDAEELKTVAQVIGYVQRSLSSRSA